MVLADVFMFNPLDCKGNHIATMNNMKLVHWPLMGGFTFGTVRRDWTGPQPTQALSCYTKYNNPPMKRGMAWHQITYRTYVCRCQLFLPALLSAPRLVETWSSLVPDDVSGIEHSASPVLRRGTVCCRTFVLHQHSVLRPSLVTLCSHKSGRCTVELYRASHLWYPPFYTSPMASSALQH